MERTQTSEAPSRSRLADKGFGRTVKGFRTARDAGEFAARWRALSAKDIRLLYPAETTGLRSERVDEAKTLIALEIQMKGVAAVHDILGGALYSAERILNAGVDAASGRTTPGVIGSVAALGIDIVVDVFINGTGPTGIPDFNSFISYRQAKAFEHHINTRAVHP